MLSTRQRSGFNFFLSCDVNLPVKVKVASLTGQLPCLQQHDRPSHCTAVYVEAKVTADGELLGLETKTTYTEATPDHCSWNEWLTLCLKYRDLPRDAQLSLNVYAVSEGLPRQLLGGTTMRLFSKQGRLKTGQQLLRLWPGRAACCAWPSSTPGKVPLAQRGRLALLQHQLKLYSRGEVQQLGWLDTLLLREVVQQQEQLQQEEQGEVQLQVQLELPSFPHAVLYQHLQSAQDALEAAQQGVAAALRDGGLGQLVVLHDPEVGLENPAELKAQKLARSLNRGMIDRDLKPNSDERRQIAAVLKLPPNKPLAAEHKALLWRFRYSLTQDKRALTKFLKCVDWGDVQEASQAGELMAQWAPIDIADALELLSPDFLAEEVRGHAVATLQGHDDEELLYYLLQLVQALRYEQADISRLARFLCQRGARNPVFATFLHWYLFVEWEDVGFGARASAVHSAFVAALNAAPCGDSVWEAIRRQTDMLSQLSYVVKELKQAKVRAARATERFRDMVSEAGPCGELAQQHVALPLDPNIQLEGLVASECSCFRSAQLPVKLSYRVSTSALDWGAQAHSAAQPSSAGTAASGAQQQPQQQPVRWSLPQRTGIVAQGEGYRCVLIYKKGDDLRQDQFVLQMLSLMDRLLKRENLDLRLTPYKVLPTSSDDGLVEYVPSVPLSRILAEHKTIHRFLAQFNSDASGPFGLRAECLETFVRSCAGYCVMTYILGVGDRHLDNLMLCPDGRLFHIDFGYILGQDPKPFPPPMKLCKEMIEAMGGAGSQLYVQFRMFSCEAYNILRKSADLILSLFHLMAGASIEAIRQDPEKAMLRLQEKLRLECDDEQAVEAMQGLINESATALMPQIVETTHRWAQYWR